MDLLCLISTLLTNNHESSINIICAYLEKNKVYGIWENYRMMLKYAYLEKNKVYGIWENYRIMLKYLKAYLFFDAQIALYVPEVV